jgi:hypothetical protein
MAELSGEQLPACWNERVGAIAPDDSLCFFYAKDTPLSAATGRVIIGVGLVRSVEEHLEYMYATGERPLRSVLWERNVEHSIRAGFEEGFLFPYAELFDLALEQGLDPEEFLAFAPDDAFWSFSHASSGAAMKVIHLRPRRGRSSPRCVGRSMVCPR